METAYTIGDFIVQQEAAYMQPIPINENWSWSMYDHIMLSTLYKNSQLKSGKDDFKPVKNITRPLLNLQYRAEGFDVKDINLFVDDSSLYYKSLLARKFHDKWARDNNLDTFIDSMVESYVDYGGALIKNVNDVKPEVVPLQSIAFCDQTDMLSGPLGLKHFFSPSQLLKMASKGWGNTSKGATATLQEVIDLSREEKRNQPAAQSTKTPGKYIEVYEVHGEMPTRYLNGNTTDETYTSQLQIVCFYQKKGSQEKGFVTLFAAPESKPPFKLILRDAIYGRALGLGGAEELFEPQVWINYDMIRIQGMLDAASKIILKSTDPAITQKNKVRDMENMEVLDIAPGTDISQVDTVPRNMPIFENSVTAWEAHAMQMSGATETLMGETPNSGTPFALHNLLAQQGMSLHVYRQGKLSTFLSEIYRDWIIPHIEAEITNGSKWLAELDLEDLQLVSSSLVTAETNAMIKKQILAGQLVPPEMIQGYQEIVQTEFKKKGNKHFIEILKGEFKNVEFGVTVNIAGKQKDLADKVDKLTNVFRTIISNPYILQSPPIAELFNKIIEASGLDPIDLSNFKIPPQPARQMRETIDYKDIQDPKAQQDMLQLAGISSPQGQVSFPQK